MLSNLDQNTLILYCLCKALGWKGQAIGELLQREIRDEHFGENDLSALIDSLHGGIPYMNADLRFSCSGDRLQVDGPSSHSAGPSGYTWISDLSLKDDLRVLAELHRNYLTVVKNHHLAEQELSTVLGDGPGPQLLVLEFLARTQKVADPEVAKCWWMFVEGISSGLSPKRVETFVGDAGLWITTGIDEFTVENVEDDKTRVSFLRDDCFCPTDAFYRELRILLGRYYDAM